jgi:hypothetical protein
VEFEVCPVPFDNSWIPDLGSLLRNDCGYLETFVGGRFIFYALASVQLANIICFYPWVGARSVH